MTASVGVDIVVPIYNARKDVVACVKSVLQHATGDWRLILADDASSDTDLVEFLRQTAEAHERVLYLRNERNGGFVLTANNGMRQANGRDVLLLNSDTIVTPRFIEKHIRCVYSAPRIGIASPFTNNGTICSVPEFCRDNELPTDIDLDAYADLIERISFQQYPSLVTAVGFCMFIRAEVIEQVGLFDDEAFGRGFGEENDFCERAKKLGWEIRLVDDCFIAHTGKASFGAEGKALEHENSQTLARMHPSYFPAVQRFIATNPLRSLQDNVRMHVGREPGRRFPAIMYMLHASPVALNGGGTEFLVRKMVQCLAWPRAIIVWPEEDAIFVMEVISGSIDSSLKFAFDLNAEVEPFSLDCPEITTRLAEIMQQFDVGYVHVHHLLRWPLSIIDLLVDAKRPLAFTAHDFLSICPSFNLIDRANLKQCPCDRSADAQRCLHHQTQSVNLKPPEDVLDWRDTFRAKYATLFDHSDHIFTPSEFAAGRLVEFHPHIQSKLHVIPHGYDPPSDQIEQPTNPRDGLLRVAVLGRFADAAKGTDSYLWLMDQGRDLPIEWHLYGDADVHGFRRKLTALRLVDRIVDHGPYAQSDICRKLHHDGVDVALILPRCDETFCFTLSEAWLAGVPVIANRKGALIERCLASSAGVLVENDHEALDQLKQFAREPEQLQPLRKAAEEFQHGTWESNTAAHRAIMADSVVGLETPRGKNGAIEKRRDDLLAAFEWAREADKQALVIHDRWWYVPYLRAKPLIPARLRHIMKRAYVKWRRNKS